MAASEPPEPEGIESTRQRRENLRELLQLLGPLKTQDKLEVEEVFKAVQVMTEREQVISKLTIEEAEARTKQKLREQTARALTWTLWGTLVLLFLHSLHVIDLPAQAITAVSVSVVGEVAGLLTILVKYLFGSESTSRRSRRGKR